MVGDLFSVSPSQLDEVSKHFSIQIAALGQLLIAKGVITEEEWTAAITQTTAQIDQHWQQRKDEIRAEFEKENPGMAFLAKVFEPKMPDG